MNVANRNRIDACGADGVVIPAGIDRIVQEQHVTGRNPRLLREPMHAIGFIDARARDVDRGGPTDANRKAGEERLEYRL